jgi:hypothetical protein
LKKQGIEVSQRTIQRDLRELQGLFPGLRCDDNRDMTGRGWDSKAIINEFPAMDAFTAFAFRLMDVFMNRMLPQALLDDLSPYRDAAQRVLDSLPSKNGLFAWENKVRIISPTQPLLPAPIKDEAMRAVYRALFEYWNPKVCVKNLAISRRIWRVFMGCQFRNGIFSSNSRRF